MDSPLAHREGRVAVRTTDLQFLLDFDAWANEQVLSIASGLTADEFVAVPGLGHAAPRSTVLHCINGMRLWRNRLEGTPISAPATEQEFPTLDSVRALWRAEHALFVTYVRGLTGEDLDAVLEQRRPDLVRSERWLLILHIVLHNVQHRSELAQALTLLGHSPGELGLTAFMRRSTGE